MNDPSVRDRVIFHLAWYANSASGEDDKNLTDKEVYDRIDGKLKQSMPEWKITWGPCVVNDPITGRAINTMYVAQRGDSPDYVVAMAGTNPYSAFDWVVEDGFVNLQVPWLYAPLSGGMIAAGTTIGLIILQQMRPSANVPPGLGDFSGKRPRLHEYLSSLTDAPFDLTVTGHSLGGALSPTVALWLRDTQGFLWDTDRRAAIKTVPFAGPTAGNGKFASHSDDKLPHRTNPDDKYWSYRYANSLDIVPHAWNEQTLEALKTVYEPEIPEDDNAIVNLLIDGAKALAKNGDYTQLVPPVPPWVGTFNDSIYTPSSSDIENFVNYFQQLLYQHVVAYEDHFAFLDVPADRKSLDEVLPPPSVITISPAIVQAIEKAGGSLDAIEKQANVKVAAGSEPVFQVAGESIKLSAGAIDEKDLVETLTNELKKFAAE